jgi:molybdopterin converting factor small subunit
MLPGRTDCPRSATVARVSVDVRIPTLLRGYTGGAASVAAAPGSVRQLVDSLETAYPGIRARVLDETGSVRRFVNIYVGEDDVRFGDGLDTEAADGATVSIIPAVAGG